MAVQDASILQDATGRNAWSGRNRLIDLLEAFALRLVGGDEGRELILQIVLGGKQVAQGHRKHLLFQLILDGEHERTQARQISPRMKLRVLDLRQHRERCFTAGHFFRGGTACGRRCFGDLGFIHWSGFSRFLMLLVVADFFIVGSVAWIGHATP